MTARAKFLFDADFGSDRNPEQIKIIAAEYQQALATAEARGFQAGVNSAEAQARAEAERRMAVALEGIGAAVERLLATPKLLEQKLEAEAVEIAFAVARKLSSALIAAEPVAEIATLAAGCLSELRNAPHVAVRVHESLHAAAREKLAEIAASRGFEGRLVVIGEADIAPGDCRIEWADGGIVRERAATEAIIAEAVDRYVEARRKPRSGNSGDQ
jgi:flagellar assembly protein FliH